MKSKIKPRHGSRVRKIVRKALKAYGGRVTTSEVAQLAYPGQWPLNKSSYGHCRWALRSYADPVGRPHGGRSIIWEARR
jgi:hypothetical protein